MPKLPFTSMLLEHCHAPDGRCENSCWAANHETYFDPRMTGGLVYAAFQRLLALYPVVLIAIAATIVLSSCTTFEPLHRRRVEFQVTATHEQFQLAAKNAAERMGGAIIERAIFTPRSAELVDTARRDQSSIYVGFMTPTSGSVLDSITLRSDGGDTATVNIKAFYPYIVGAAIQEELDYPKPITSVSERRAARVAMTSKSRLLFSGLSLLSPALANTYLLIGNPFAGDSPELTSILVPMTVDAGFFYFLLAEHGNKRTPGTIALGLAAVFMRLSGLFSISKEIDRYNTVVRSGYSLDLEDIKYFKTRLSLNVILP